VKTTLLVMCATAAIGTLITSARAQTAGPAAVDPAPANWRKPKSDCATLGRVALPRTQIVSAQDYAAGMFQPPNSNNPFTGAPVTPPPIQVPAFCRLVAVLRPTTNSNINIEVWLPSAGWNQKFLGIGNGGFAGSILYPDLASGLRAGYVTVSTDTGHSGGMPKAFENTAPDVLTDYGWRAAHEMTITAKRLVSAYYKAPAKVSYFSGCSGGGRMALIEAQRFPADYDGVLAGSAAFSYARLTAHDLWSPRVNVRDSGPILGAAQFALLRKGALDACDANDGVKDGQISDPRACAFRPAMMQCKPGQSQSECLTAEQVDAAEKLYAGMQNTKSGAVLSAGMLPGAEPGYAVVASAPMFIAQDFYRYVVLHKPDWDYRQLDYAGGVENAEVLTADIIASPDLTAFGRRGGKLIQYAGWNENTPPPGDAIAYYEAAADKAGGDANESRFHKLFIVPNGNHCGGGYAVPWFQALENWVEHDAAPTQLLADRLADASPPGPPGVESVKPQIVGRRPLCAYPAVQQYIGAGDANKPESFRCATAAAPVPKK
jgi:feruloyl esterase